MFPENVLPEGFYHDITKDDIFHPESYLTRTENSITVLKLCITSCVSPLYVCKPPNGLFPTAKYTLLYLF